MATLHAELTTSWTELGTSLSLAVIQAAGATRVHIGADTPASTAAGFHIASGVPVVFTNVDTLGGGVWVRSVLGNGGVTYAVV
jgi:hypothetical protein